MGEELTITTIPVLEVGARFTITMRQLEGGHLVECKPGRETVMVVTRVLTGGPCLIAPAIVPAPKKKARLHPPIKQYWPKRGRWG